MHAQELIKQEKAYYEAGHLVSDQELSKDTKYKIQCLRPWKLEKSVKYFRSGNVLVSI